MVALEPTYRPSKNQFRINPATFTLWLFIITIIMLFGAFTSALVVGRPDAIANGTWQTIDIPFNFTLSTILIILSSVSMQWAYYTAKKDNIDQNRIALIITFLLGIGFVFSQLAGYKALRAENVYFTGLVKVGDKMVSPLSGSFFYAITGIHALHVVGGIIILLFSIIASLRFKVHSRNMLRMNLVTTYWHFIGLLWVYLFILLNIYR
jgi:cytochrome c oxidase subunit III